MAASLAYVYPVATRKAIVLCLIAANGCGDIVVHILVKIPTHLSREQRKLFEQLRELLPAENEPEEKGILDKVKDYFM